jgi:hypothetical protein
MERPGKAPTDEQLAPLRLRRVLPQQLRLTHKSVGLPPELLEDNQ